MVTSRIRNISPLRYAALLDRSRLRWQELSLLLLPAAFMVLGVIELEIANAVTGNISSVDKPASLPVGQTLLFILLPALGFVAALLLAHIVLTAIAPDADQTILPVAGMLAAIGVLESFRLGPTPQVGVPQLGAYQLGYVVAGLVLCVATVRVTHDLSWLRNFKYTWAAAGLVLVAVTLVVAHSHFDPTAPNRDALYIHVPGIRGFTFQPSELLKICLVIFFAGYLSENRESLASGRFKIGPISLPPLKHLGPLVAMLGVSLAIFMYIPELGLGLLTLGVFLSMLYVASNRPMYIVVSLLLFVGGIFLVAKLYPYAANRLDLLGNAFAPNPNDPGQPVGFQVVRGLIAFASGGVLGSGLGLGQPTTVPASYTDFIASSFGEEFGFAGILALIGLFMLLVYRGMHIATRARNPFNQLLAVGLTSIFALQTLVILAGNLNIMPLTGVPLPFVAYGGSSLLANFIIIGLLLRVSMADA